MHALPRLSTSIVGASAVTLGLFFLMQMLIVSNYIIPEEIPSKPPIFYPKVEPTPPPTPPEPSEWVETTTPGLPVYQTPNPTKNGPTIVIISDPMPPDYSGQDINFGDTDAIMVVQTHTMYPIIAEQRGIEGSALVEFTVGADGTVVDAILIEEDPEGYGFGRAALQAIVKFKFRARVVDGQTVAAPGMRELFQFEMLDE